MNRPKAIIYTRVSTDEQSERGTSLETQRQDCLKKCGDIGGAVVDVVSDEGISGSTLTARPGILRALSLIEQQQANLLVCYDLSRLSRNVEHQAIIKRRVEAAGGRLLFVCGHYSDDEEGELFYTIDGGFKQYERKVIRRRTMRGKRKNAEAGQQPARTQSPLGYRVVTKEDVMRGIYPFDLLGRYVLIEEQARIVRELYQRCASGASLRQLAAWIDEQGVPTQRGGVKWHPTTIRFLLQNSCYVGQPIYGKREWKLEDGHESGKPAPIENQILLSCEPIIDRPTWEFCQTRIADNKTRLAGARDRKYLLSGMFRCPACRRALAHCTEHGGRRYYRCVESNRANSYSGRLCLKKTYGAATAETVLTRDLRYLATRPECFLIALETFEEKQRQAQQQDHGGELDRLRQELAGLDQQEAATARAQVDALMKGRSTEVYDTLLTEIDGKRRTLQARLAALSPKEEQAPLDHATQGAKIAEVLRRFEEVLSAPVEDLSNAEKNGLLSRFISAIYPTEGGYTVELRLPLSATVQCVTIYCTVTGEPVVRVTGMEAERRAA